MKANCKALKLSLMISIISLIIVLFLSILLIKLKNNDTVNILLNISIGVFGSGFVTLLLCIPAYKESKRQLLDNYWIELKKIIMQFYKLDFLFFSYNPKTVISYLNEIIHNNNAKKLNEISGSNIIPEENKYKELMIKEYIDRFFNLEEIEITDELRKRVLELVEEDMKKISLDANKLYEQYIEISIENLDNLALMIADMQFFTGKKMHNAIVNNTYEPLCKMINKIGLQSGHFKLFLNGEGNAAVSLEKLNNLQNEIFNIDVNESESDIIYVINNEYFDNMLKNINNLWVKLYDQKFPLQDYPTVEVISQKKYK